MTNHPTRRGLAAVTLPAAFAIGSARAEAAAQSTLERVTRRKQLRMAVISGSPPYFQKDIATGVWAGAAVEMAKSSGIGTIREQMIAGLALNGVTPDQVPAELSF